MHKKILSSGNSAITLIIWNDEMEDIMKIVKSLKDSGLLLNDSVKQFKMKQKNKKEDFLVCY